MTYFIVCPLVSLAVIVCVDNSPCLPFIAAEPKLLFELHLWRICEYVITEYGKVIFKTDAISEEDRLIILHAYEDECFGKVMGWINRGMKTDERERLIRFLELRSGVAEMMLNRAKKN